jgi:hypothetical protein
MPDTGAPPERIAHFRNTRAHARCAWPTLFAGQAGFGTLGFI